VQDKVSGLAFKVARIAVTLGGSPRPDGKGNFVCHCPADGHAGGGPSLSICERDGRLLVHCFAGCAYKDIMAALKRLKLAPGPAGSFPSCPVDSTTHPPLKKFSTDPLKMWRKALWCGAGSLIELYLLNRGLGLPENAPLRVAPALWHWPTQTRHPAMVALVQRCDGAELAGYATFLTLDGRKAAIDPVRLFPSGARPWGGGVWFKDLGDRHELIVAEGIESALAAAYLYDANACVATLSTQGMRTLVLPVTPQGPIRIFADHDAAGYGIDAARDLYRRLRSEGREVVISVPDAIGEDANDIWLRRQGVCA
jgi:hypothetical protein